MIHIALSGETLFTIGFFHITNTILSTWIVMALLTIGSYFATKKLTRIPDRMQLVVEFIIDGLFTTFYSILGKKTRRYFPLLATLFLFIIISNWFGLLPGVGSIGIKENPTIEYLQETSQPHTQTNSQQIPANNKETNEPVAIADTSAANQDDKYNEKAFDVPLFRAPTADLNTTLALSIVGMIMLQYWGARALGLFAYISKFITFKDPISFFVGILELVSELGKVISFAFRLFGNIFAGEVLLIIIGFLIPYIAPLPFLGLELFVGFIQAIVFSMLLAVFLSVATTQAHH